MTSERFADVFTEILCPLNLVLFSGDQDARPETNEGGGRANGLQIAQ